MSSLRPVSGSAEEVLDLLRDWETADDPAPLVVATSGSTGRPKRVMLSRTAMRASADATHARLGGPGQWLLTVPPTYVAGLQVLFRSLRAGTEPVLLPLDQPLAGSLEQASGPGRYLSLVPTQLNRLLRGGEAAALAGLDAVLVGGGPLARGDRTAAEDAGVSVVPTSGMSETCGGCVYDGRPLDGVAVRTDAEGRVLVAGPVLFDGYQGDVARTAAVLRDGWFRTDDLGQVGDDGRVSIFGRADDVIVSGGVNVPPGAVEEMLSASPRVEGVAVVGVPDHEWGERVVAVVVGEAPPLSELRDLVRPREWAPRSLVLVDQLPLLPTGKVDRPAVRRLAGD